MCSEDKECTVVYKECKVGNLPVGSVGGNPMVSAGLGQNSGLPVVGRLLKVSQETSLKAIPGHSELV